MPESFRHFLKKGTKQLTIGNMSDYNPEWELAEKPPTMHTINERKKHDLNLIMKDTQYYFCASEREVGWCCCLSEGML